jgi:hypothetical protein
MKKQFWEHTQSNERAENPDKTSEFLTAQHSHPMALSAHFSCSETTAMGRAVLETHAMNRRMSIARALMRLPFAIRDTYQGRRNSCSLSRCNSHYSRWLIHPFWSRKSTLSQLSLVRSLCCQISGNYVTKEAEGRIIALCNCSWITIKAAPHLTSLPNPSRSRWVHGEWRSVIIPLRLCSRQGWG